jgi:hypothetical protein
MISSTLRERTLTFDLVAFIIVSPRVADKLAKSLAWPDY